MTRAARPIVPLIVISLFAWGCLGSGGDGDSSSNEEACEDFCSRGVECGFIGDGDVDECEDDCEDVIDEAVDITDACEDAIIAYIDCVVDLACEDVVNLEEEAPTECRDAFDDAADACEGQILGDDDDDGGIDDIFFCPPDEFIDLSEVCDGDCDCGSCFDEDEIICAAEPAQAARADEDLMSHEFFDYTRAN